LRSQASKITFRKELKKPKLPPPLYFFSCIQKEKLLSLKVKQPASRKENTVWKIVFRKVIALLLLK